MVKILLAEFHKLKGTWLLWLIIALIYTDLCALLIKVTSLAKFGGIQAFLSLTGASLPLVVGIISYQSLEKEALAGNYQAMLIVPYTRRQLLLGKFFSLLICVSSILCISVITFLSFLGQNSPRLWGSLIIFLLLGCLQEFWLHIWLQLKFDVSVTLSVAFSEVVVSLLFLTGLGDRLWYYVPSSWSARLAVRYFMYGVTADFKLWEIVGIPVIVGSGVLALIWFNHWDIKENEG